VLHPDCNHVPIMEQHLQLLAMGQPVLKPVYDHGTGQFTRPVLVEPRRFVIVEGLLPLHTKLARACFDATVYLDPPEDIRRAWKVRRDTAERGYTAEQVLAELERREPESAAFIRPQRAFADIVIRFAAYLPFPLHWSGRPGRHAAFRRAAAAADDQASRPGRRGARRHGARRHGVQRYGARVQGHPPQARA